MTTRSTRRQVTERLEVIEQLMRRAQWDRGRTSRALAKEWGVSLEAVNDYAAEASKRVREDVTDPEQVTLSVSAALSTIVRESMRDGDRRNAIKAGETWARVAGALVQKHEVAVTPDEVEKLIAEAKALP